MSIKDSLNKLNKQISASSKEADTVQKSLKEFISALGEGEKISVTDDTIAELIDILADVLPDKIGGGGGFSPEYVSFSGDNSDIAKELPALNLNGLDTSNVTDMSKMFSRLSELTTLDVSGFNTSKVTNMQSMFYSCSKLTELDLSNFDTSKLTNAYGMFSYCQGLKRLNISSFTTESLTSAQSMFNECNSLIFLDMRNFTFQNSVTADGMFSNLVPSNCEIIVKSETEKTMIQTYYSRFTNIKTVSEYEG